MSQESPPAVSLEPQNKLPPRELYSNLLRALYAVSGGRARKRRLARRARGNVQRLERLLADAKRVLASVE